MIQEKEYNFPGGSFIYEVHNGEAAVTRLQGLCAEVTVPAQLEEVAVTTVGRKAFLSKKYLRAVKLPQTVRELGDWAFAYCEMLEYVTLPPGQLQFGKAVFLGCGSLKALHIPGKSEATGALLAAAAMETEAGYLLNSAEAGSSEWFAKWDAWMMTVLKRPDSEGYTNQVLCGEEDYGSTDVDAFLTEKRRKKVRLLLLRLQNDEELRQPQRQRITQYLLSHAKGCESEETWQVILNEHGEDQAYFRLLAELGGITADNLEGMLADAGEDHPELTAFLLRYKEEEIGYSDFFDGLEL